MEEKLEKLYKECIDELGKIDIHILDEKTYGKMDINLSSKSPKRYGCCKQSEPLSTYYHIEYRNHRRIKIYDVFMKHNIEISKWVLELNDDIIKNTIMHELIHCLPYCNNHGKEFKKYAEFIN